MTSYRAHAQLIREGSVTAHQLSEPLCTDPGDPGIGADFHFKKKKKGKKRHRQGLSYQKSSTKILICEEKITSSQLHTEGL